MLNILRKLPSGYHELESVFYFLENYYDVLIFDRSKEFNANSAIIKGVLPEDNSIIRAAKILKHHFDFKIPHVEVVKNLPICGGVGGGSSNSACFISQVFDIYGFSKSEKLKHIDLFDELGCDNKVFLYKYFTNCKAIYLKGTGIDGVIKPIDLNIDAFRIELFFSNCKLSTKDVFKNFKGPFMAEIGFENLNISHILNFNNSLQDSAIELCPSLREQLDRIKSTKPIICGVSGSGPTCFVAKNQS